MRTLALLAAVAGCSYNPGSFSYPTRRFPGQRTTVGCLDISVDRRPDMNDSAVLDYQFGNRCDTPVVVDLVRVPVVGRTTDGEEVTLTPFDPELEMMAKKLGARQAGGEAIAYPTTQPLVQVCVDAAAIYADAGDAKRWLCFGSNQVAEVTP